MIRKGQQAFNDLYAKHPEIADQIRGTSIDPFYNDECLTAFYAKVKSLLENKE